MKRTLCLIVVLAMLLSAAFADFDLSGMTDDELMELRDQIDAELLARNIPEEGTIINENDVIGYRLVYRSYEITTSARTGIKTVTVHVEWTNLSDRERDFGVYHEAVGYADGVQVYCTWSGTSTTIRPNVTLPMEITCRVSTSAEQLEFQIRSAWGGTPVYFTMMIPLN